MPIFRRVTLGIALGTLLLGFISAGWTAAQDDSDSARGHASFSATFEVNKQTTAAKLFVTAKIEPDWHIYSATQKPGGPIKSTITVKSAALADPKAPINFQPDHKPSTHVVDAWPGLPVEEHEGTVTWSATVPLKSGVDPESLEFAISFSGQVCQTNGACIQFREQLKPEFTSIVDDNKPVEKPVKDEPVSEPPANEESAEPAAPPLIDFSGDLGKGGFGLPRVAGTGGEVDEGDEVSFAASFEVDQAHKQMRVQVTATPQAGWHIYSVAQKKGGPIRTRITLESAAIDKAAPAPVFQPDTAPKVHFEEFWPDVPVEEHEGKVTWTALVPLAKDIDPKTIELHVAVQGQVCKSSCVNFKKSVEAKFAGVVDKFEPIAAAAAPANASRAHDNAVPPGKSSHDAEGALAGIGEATTAEKTAAPTIVGGNKLQFWQAALFGLLGGIILNAMPCVLPVIGLKVLAFAEQAGQSRSRILTLNLWYCAGLIAVFLVLATMAAFLNIGWSGAFGSITFRYIMLSGVFVMGLSFLGVWEIPIPGFAASSEAQGLQEKEGAFGAFSKGVFTTILATPCSGPFLGGVFFYTVSAPWYETYLIFTCIGVGMALPYLLVGIEPRLVKWLPKPGAWMETFKQAMGFIMLGTSIYLFQTVQNPGNIVAVLTMLLGLGVACWWIGRTPAYAEMGQKLAGWGVGGALATVITVIGFNAFYAPFEPAAPGSRQVANSGGHRFEWQPYSEEALQKARAEGKTVMIDFTASWCPNCHYNTKIAINTEATQQIVEKNNVVAMLADWSDQYSEEGLKIRAKLKELGSNTIPFLAIYSAERPDDVQVLPDVISQNQLVTALEKAGPSRVAAVTQNKQVASDQ